MKRKDTNNNHRLENGKLTTVRQTLLCHFIIHIAAVINAIIGLLPLLDLSDSIFIGIFQIIMAVLLGLVFKQKISLSLFKGVIVWCAASFIGRNLVQYISGIGWIVSALVAFIVTEIVGWGVTKDMAESFRLEWHRKNSAIEAANAYAEAEYYKQNYETNITNEEAEDFSN